MLSVIMLNVIMLNVVVLNVVMLNVVMLNVVAPEQQHLARQKHKFCIDDTSAGANLIKLFMVII
jgi:hypothetical protein